MKRYSKQDIDKAEKIIDGWKQAGFIIVGLLIIGVISYLPYIIPEWLSWGALLFAMVALHIALIFTTLFHAIKNLIWALKVKSRKGPQ